jgi:hypothetical protein
MGENQKKKTEVGLSGGEMRVLVVQKCDYQLCRNVAIGCVLVA